MFARTSVLSLALLCIVSNTAALDLDVQNQGNGDLFHLRDSKLTFTDSIKNAAKTLAKGVVTFYNDGVSASGLPGLLPDPYFWYEGGVILNALIEYSYLTGDTQYDSIVSEGIQAQLGEEEATFMPMNQTAVIANDDQSIWALAALTAAETGFSLPENRSWAEYAADVFNMQVQRWDAESCEGGLRWTIFSFQNGYEYKSMAANGDFFLLAARLAQFTRNETYSEWADKSLTWAKDRGLISDSYEVYDGALASDDCADINQIQWTYTHAVYTEGSAIMQNIVSTTRYSLIQLHTDSHQQTDGAGKWTDAIQGFVKSSDIFFKDDILTEVACENDGRCDIDMRAFKGIAARSYARAVIAAPSIAEPLTKKLEASAKAAASACDGESEDVKCTLAWADPNTDKWESATASDGNLNEVFDALAVVQSLLFSQAKPLTSNATEAGAGGNATQKESASGTSGGAAPQETGAAGTIAASVTAVLAVAFAAALSC
jgi:mannan endo-1,6-alpha-mannosidase